MLITSGSLRVKDWFSLDNQGLRSFFLCQEGCFKI